LGWLGWYIYLRRFLGDKRDDSAKLAHLEKGKILFEIRSVFSTRRRCGNGWHACMHMAVHYGLDLFILIHTSSAEVSFKRVEKNFKRTNSYLASPNAPSILKTLEE
jgi:hypothetical protein